MFKKILIVGHSNIGDVCYDLAVVDPMRQKYPKAKIAFLTSPQGKNIVRHHKGIDEIITFYRHGKEKGFFNRLKFILRLRKEKFDLAVVLRKSFMFNFFGAVKAWVAKKDSKNLIHPVDLYLNLLRKHGVEVKKASFHYNLLVEEQSFCDAFLKEKGVGPNDPLIGILPLAAWSLKSWPIDKWNELAGILKHQYGMNVINLGKLPDDDIGEKVSQSMTDDIISADQSSLTQAMALLQRCRLFIGPDSSFLHLASCMGIETIGLYGATLSDCFFPYFHRHNIILPNKKLDCMPCYPGSHAVCCDVEVRPDFGPCMHGINVEEVLKEVKKVLKLDK